MEELILRFSDSLGREIAGIGREVADLRQEMTDGFNRIDNSTKRHSGMIISGTLAIGTMTKALTRIEAGKKIRDAQIRELKNRVRRLEHRKKAG